MEDKDIVIYEIETKEIIAIITNKDFKNSSIITNKKYSAVEVDNSKNFIRVNEKTGKIYFRDLESKILYLKDFI